jgi:eukaryotic-like serine/threonine-protein kinase
MGTVWRARDVVDQRTVAVKILHDTAAEPSQRFAREATLLAGLAHGSIVEYVAHGTTPEGTPYLAMEWLDGETVAERLAREPPTLRESLAIVRATARGLAAAHARGVVHRDIKPSNLFLRRSAVDDVVLLDLGLARHVYGGDALTRAGAILGTPAYMAPEQAQGLLAIGPAADVFSLGCVLFECIVGASPFAAEHVLSVLARVLFEDAPRLRQLRAEVPLAVEALVERMLAKDPARRPADAAALQIALDEIGAVVDVAAPPPVVAAAADSVNTTADELELISVVLACPPRGAGVSDATGDTLAPDASPPSFPDLAPYGGQVRRLADGTALVLITQRSGAATDLAVRAARCALRLRERCPGWTVALATGRGAPQRRLDLGDAVERASAILRLHTADSGIGIDEVTAGLLGARFRVTAAGGRLVLDSEEPTIDPSRPLLGQPTACVGREHELATLSLTFETCVDESSPRAVLVVADPGLGKSRLRHEMVRRLGDREALVLLGQGDPIRNASSSGLLGGAVLRGCRLRGDPGSGVASGDERATFATRIGAHLAPEDRLRTAVFMGELCGVRFPVDAMPELALARQDPRLLSTLVTKAWLTFLRAEAALRPVLIVLDDLQWSDPLSVSLVDTALRELTTSPVMVLALGRPEVQGAFPDLWAPRLAMVPLRPLGAGVTARFVRQVLGDRASDDSVQRIVARSAGNALYVEELIRAAADGREAPPDTVLAMLQARIGQLPPLARRVLRAASVFGEAVPAGGIEAVLGAPATELEAPIASLLRQEILERPGESAARDAQWRFRHVLMRDAAYGLLTAEDRQTSHALAARFLEERADAPAVVATHYQRGGDTANAVRCFIAAADLAYRTCDLQAAITLVDQGLAAGATGVDRGVLRAIAAPAFFYRWDFAACWNVTEDALAMLPPDHPKRALCLAWRACVAMQLGRSDQVEHQVDEIVRAEPGDADLVDYGYALGYAICAHVPAGRRGHAQTLAARLDAVDARLGRANRNVHAFSHYAHARIALILGDDPHAAWVHAVAARDTFAGTGDWLYAFAYNEVGECARRLIPFADAVATLRDGVALAAAMRVPMAMSILAATALAEHGADSDQPEARALATRMVEMAAAGTIYHAFGEIALGLVTLRDGDAAGAETLIRAGRDALYALGMYGYTPFGDASLLRVLLARGDTSAAAIADGALAFIAERGPVGSAEVDLRVLCARAHLLAGRLDEARRGVEAARVVLARRAARVPDELRAGFLADVPENIALRELAGSLGIAEATPC